MNYRHDEQRLKRQRLIHIVILAGVVVLSAIILYVDIATGWWGETVILSGMAAGLVTYLVTSLVVDRLIHSEESERWSPVTRLAIGDILHTLIDDEASGAMSGTVVPRSLDAPQHFTKENIKLLSQAVVTERDDLAASLAKWASFLVAEGDVQDLIVVLSDTAQELDDVRVAINAWRTSRASDKNQDEAAVRKEISEYNERIDAAVQESQKVLNRL